MSGSWQKTIRPQRIGMHLQQAAHRRPHVNVQPALVAGINNGVCTHQRRHRQRHACVDASASRSQMCAGNVCWHNSQAAQLRLRDLTSRAGCGKCTMHAAGLFQPAACSATATLCSQTPRVGSGALGNAPEFKRVPWSASSTTGTARTTAPELGASSPGSATGRPSIAKYTLRSTPAEKATA